MFVRENLDVSAPSTAIVTCDPCTLFSVGFPGLALGIFVFSSVATCEAKTLALVFSEEIEASLRSVATVASCIRSWFI